MNQVIPYSQTKLAHELWEGLIEPGDTAIDATCGNGKDSVALASFLFPHPKARLIVIDIQKKALENTELALKGFLSDQQLQQVSFLHSCHSQMPKDLKPKLITYNLGYLPGSDKQLTTQAFTTLASIECALALLEPKSCISIMIYKGHEQGKKEDEALKNYLKSLDNSYFSCRSFNKLNFSLAPELIWVECLKKNT